MNEKAVIDRFEDGLYAVLLVGEDERERIVPVNSLPEEARPGMWLQVQFEDDVLTHVVIDRDETERVKERVEDKLARLRRRGRHANSTKPEE